MKTRFLDVLWFHFHHLALEGLTGQPGTPPPPAPCPRRIPAFRWEQSSHGSRWDPALCQAPQ